MCTRIKLGLLAVLASVSLTGCVFFTPSISQHETPSSGDAYVYGRFSMGDTIKTLYGTHGSMGFDFACKNNNQIYTIGFSVDEPIQVIKLRGGDICSLVSVTYTDSVGGWAGTNSVGSPELRRAIRYDAGKAYYVGDFVGSFGYSAPGMLRWEVADAQDNFHRTTRELKSLFPNMAAFPTENKMVH